jgi:hypothetical protein
MYFLYKVVHRPALPLHPLTCLSHSNIVAMADYIQHFEYACQVVGQFYRGFASQFRDNKGNVVIRPTEVGLTDQFILAVSQSSHKNITIVSAEQVLVFRVSSINLMCISQTRTPPATESVEGHNFVLKFNVGDTLYQVFVQGT